MVIGVVRAGGPEGGACDVDVTGRASLGGVDPPGGNLVPCAPGSTRRVRGWARWCGQASESSLIESRWGSPIDDGRVPGAYLRHARRWRGDMKPSGHDPTSSSTLSTAPVWWSCRLSSCAGSCPTSRRVSGLQATDLAVAHSEVDEREEMTSGSDTPDVDATTDTDTSLDRCEPPLACRP